MRLIQIYSDEITVLKVHYLCYKDRKNCVKRFFELNQQFDDYNYIHCVYIEKSFFFSRIFLPTLQQTRYPQFHLISRLFGLSEDYQVHQSYNLFHS
jgi:hypothetical protein